MAPGTATHSLTLYRHASGALVFGAGTIQWSWGLDNNHDRQPDGVTDYTNQSVQQGTVNLLGDMGAQPATLQAGLTPASPSADVVPPTSAITSPVNGAPIPSGTTVTISGTAADTNGVVAGVEVSTDGGATWRRATGPAELDLFLADRRDGRRGPQEPRDRRQRQHRRRVDRDRRSTLTCPCSLWNPATTTPATVDAGDPSSVELGVKFRTDVSGYITGIRFYKSAGNLGQHVGKVYNSAGTLLGSADVREREPPAAGSGSTSAARSTSRRTRPTSRRITRPPVTTRRRGGYFATRRRRCCRRCTRCPTRPR